MNWSRPISNNSLVMPAPPLCSTGARGFLTTAVLTRVSLKFVPCPLQAQLPSQFVFLIQTTNVPYSTQRLM